MKARKEILAALEKLKEDLLAALNKKSAPSRNRKNTTESSLKPHFEALAEMLSNESQPNRFKIMTIVAPLADALDAENKVPDGLLDILSPEARKSILMLFLFHMLKDADEATPAKPDYPDRVHLDISEGDNIPTEVVEGQIPYKRRSQQKLDRGF